MNNAIVAHCTADVVQHHFNQSMLAKSISGLAVRKEIKVQCFSLNFVMEKKRKYIEEYLKFGLQA